jgi:predicted esterase
VGLSGGLIGPDDLIRSDQGSLDGTPVFLGCSDVDPHIPAQRVRHAADALAALGGDVTMRFYPNMPHAINEDELEFVGRLMASVRKAQP